MLKILFALIVTGSTFAVAHADPIVANTWYEFAFTTVGTPATACTNCEPSSGTPTTFAGNPPYTFTLSATSTLVVQDAFLSGDAFAVYDSGALLGSTSFSDAGSNCGSDPVICALDPTFSHGAFSLGSGTHSIYFIPTESVVNNGAAYFEYLSVPSSVTPEPSSFLLLGTGFLGSLGVIRRRLFA